MKKLTRSIARRHELQRQKQRGRIREFKQRPIRRGGYIIIDDVSRMPETPWNDQPN